MRKIPTLFVRDENDRRYVTAEVNPEAQWVIDGEGVATRKYDGTCMRHDQGGNWWARREVKPGKAAPDGFIEEEHDETTGKTVGWEPVYRSPFVKAWDEAWTAQRATGVPISPGTFELVGPKVNGNPERRAGHELIAHVAAEVLADAPLDFDGLRAWLADFDGEGVVWHHPDGRMAKLKRRDFPPVRS